MIEKQTRRFKLHIMVVACLICIMGETFPQNLANKNATPETKNLKAFLDSVYSLKSKILSGQVDDSYLQTIINESDGKSPAIMGYDFNNILPRQKTAWNDDDKAIKWVKHKGGIAQFQWHWVSPNGDGDWTSTTFNLSTALADTVNQSYKNIIRDLDTVAGAIKKMQDSGITILWRPLHEAEGGWFWWGMKGKAACQKLWNLMYQRFTYYHKLNNLIWIWNSYAGADNGNWYPGDSVVDIIAYDYPDYSATGSWSKYESLFGKNGKLFGVGEDGTLIDPNILSTQHWLYFLTWAYMISYPKVNSQGEKSNRLGFYCL